MEILFRGKTLSQDEQFYFFDKGHKNTKTMCIEWRDAGFCMRELFRDYRLSSDFSIIEEKIFTYRGDIKTEFIKQIILIL